MTDKHFTGTILVVDDSLETLHFLSHMLEKKGYKIRTAKTGREAIVSVHECNPDLILLDIMLPDMLGYDVCKALKSKGKTKAIPVIFISALYETSDKLLGFASGGVDFITKPFIFEEVLIRVQTHLEIGSLHSQMKDLATELKRKNEQLSIEVHKQKQYANKLEESLNKLEKTKKATLNLLEDLRSEIELRKKNEQALSESEEKFSAAFMTSPYALTITDLNDGRFIEANDVFTTLTGFTRTETIGNAAIGMKLWLEIKERDWVVNELLNGRRVAGKEFCFRKKGGKVMTGLYYAHLIRLKNENYIFSSINDITEKKKAEEDLRESEQTFSDMFQKSPVSIILTVPEDSTIIDVNESFLRDMEYTRNEVIGRSTVELGLFFDLADREKLREMLRQKSYVFGYECGFRSKSGVILQGLLSIVFIKHKGQLFQLSTVIDITDRNKTRDALVESEAKYRNLFNTMKEGLALHQLVYSSSGKAVNYRIIDVNPSFEKILGHTRDKAVNCLATDLYEVDSPPFLEQYTEVTETGVSSTFEVFFPPMNKDFRIVAFSRHPGFLQLSSKISPSVNVQR